MIFTWRELRSQYLTSSPIVLNHNQFKWIYCLHDNVAVRPYRQPLTQADGCLPAPETLLGGSPYGKAGLSPQS